MSGCVNKVIIVGYLGRDPEVKKISTSESFVSLSVATNEKWVDKKTGERREKTEWHQVSIFEEGIASFVASFFKKGDRIYVEGKIENQSWVDRDGVEKRSARVVVNKFNGGIVDIRQSYKNNEDYSDRTGIEQRFPIDTNEIPF